MKNKILKMRVSTLEKAIIVKKAAQSGITVSEYLRGRALNYAITYKLTKEELECYKSLSKYADNFRRISNLFKLGDVTGMKNETLETSRMIKEHLEKFK